VESRTGTRRHTVRHRKVLDELLTVVLPEGRIDTDHTAGDPVAIASESESALPEACTEFTLRTEELASLELTSRLLFVVENEITYLAFPHVADVADHRKLPRDDH
jgi:hypothetical protein